MDASLSDLPPPSFREEKEKGKVPTSLRSFRKPEREMEKERKEKRKKKKKRKAIFLAHQPFPLPLSPRLSLLHSTPPPPALPRTVSPSLPSLSGRTYGTHFASDIEEPPVRPPSAMAPPRPRASPWPCQSPLLLPGDSDNSQVGPAPAWDSRSPALASVGPRPTASGASLGRSGSPGP